MRPVVIRLTALAVLRLTILKTVLVCPVVLDVHNALIILIVKSVLSAMFRMMVIVKNAELTV